jgi:hypothetical protein
MTVVEVKSTSFREQGLKGQLAEKLEAAPPSGSNC